ncbi:hypothetical protein LIP_0347 [Limnochorda pilosa]|uniref:Lipid/polyisoprenoid-binding YceI-like domain-containing protein n=1 Tax=Limnochorda pilosa TaxID=1555112 RepID=A0A0K2SHB9_LIMPI|nr:hypothetical protein LIP_0347 [Limnochorda pilosa]
MPSESRALYRVGETFLRFDRPGVAVGVTQAISGELSMDVEQSTEGVFGMVRVDLSELTSDEPRRDRAIREQWLQSAQFPIAEFRPTGLELHAPYQDGQELPVTVHGELTIRNLTRPTAWTGSLILEGDTLRSTVTTQIRMTEYGFEPPSVLGVLRAEDEASIEVEIVARRDDS